MAEEKSTGLEPNVAGLLCYVLGWITGLVFLLIEPKDKFVRFHAWQSIFVFGTLTVVNFIFMFIPILGWIISMLIGILALILWIMLMVKAYQGQKMKVPVAGNLAEKQA